MKRTTTDVALLLLRVTAGAVFLPHGWSKVFGEGGAAAFAADMPQLGLPQLLGYIVPYAELVGGVLLIAGLITRVDAFLLACTMAAAIVRVHLPDTLVELQPNEIKILAILRGIELPLALLGINLALLMTGGGRFSLDAALRVDERIAALFRKKKAAAEAAA